MIRKSLYLAASAAVLMTAAQAQAAVITGSGVFTGVTSTTATGAFKLAQELTYYTAVTTSAAATQAAATFALQPTTGFTTGQSLLLTVDIASGGVFTTATAFSATGTGTCVVDNLVGATPVAANATSAEYLIQLSGTCTGTANGIAISAPVQATGADMVIGAKLQQSFGGQLINVDGGRVAATFVDVTRAFSATVSASGNTATAQVADGYLKLNSGTVELGSVVVTANTAVSKALSATATVSAADVAGVTLTATAVTGSFSGINFKQGSTLFGTGTSTATTSTVRVLSLPATSTGTFAIDVVDNTSTATNSGINADAVIEASTFTVSAVVDLATGLTDVSASGVISPVVRDGTSFIAPWIALGAPSANSTIRLANNGTTGTGPIQMTLKSSNGSAATTSTVTISDAQLVTGDLNAQGGIPAGGVVSISGAALKTAFGTDAANGDVEVTIEAQPQFISGKVRVTQAGTNQIFETSLNNLK